MFTLFGIQFFFNWPTFFFVLANVGLNNIISTVDLRLRAFRLLMIQVFKKDTRAQIQFRKKFSWIFSQTGTLIACSPDHYLMTLRRCWTHCAWLHSNLDQFSLKPQYSNNQIYKCADLICMLTKRKDERERGRIFGRNCSQKKHFECNGHKEISTDEIKKSFNLFLRH